MYDPSRGYPVVVPCLLYDDLPAAASWLVETLGFREILRATLPDGWTGHIELERDGFVLLLGRRGGQFAEAASLTPGVRRRRAPPRVTAAWRPAARSLDPAAERPWGVLQAVLADPGGQRWLVTSHVRDTDPADWYGTVLGPMPG